MNKLGDFIKDFRLKNGLSLREFGKLTNISHTHIDSIERGSDHRTGKPVKLTNYTIERLAKATRVNPSFLFELSIDKGTDNYAEQKMKTIYAQIDGEEWTEEELKELENFKEYIKSKRNK